jgi:hypothetical protein
MAKQPRGLGGRVHARRAAFRPEYLDFDRGIRMGHLEPEERITQILKSRLAERHGIRFICDRWGRGVYWQWICWVPEPNRKAKPKSNGYNFGSAKLFVSIDQEDRVFQSGIQIERAPVRPPPGEWPLKLEDDWDWHVLLRALGEPALSRILGRLVREGFRVRAGAFENLTEFGRKNWDLAKVRAILARMPPSRWGGFQLFWPMSEAEVKKTSGDDLVDSIMAVYAEVAPAANLCMYAPCLKE